MSARGLFITVEGGEGVGKSTNIAFLEAQLRDRGVDLLVTREPGGTRLGDLGSLNFGGGLIAAGLGLRF